MVTSKMVKTAKQEGRVCEKCGWIISKKNWAKGYRQCPGCWSASKGVQVRTGAYPYRDEPKDMTGEMQ